MSQDSVEKILTKYKTVAVVGLSRDPSKDSYRVAEYLKNQGYRIVPVNPSVTEVLGEKSYGSLLGMPADVQKSLEIVDIFRPAADVKPIVEQAVQIRSLHGVPRVVWMQLGIANEEVAETAKKAGLEVVMNKCMMREHLRVVGMKKRSERS